MLSMIHLIQNFIYFVCGIIPQICQKTVKKHFMGNRDDKEIFITHIFSLDLGALAQFLRRMAQRQFRKDGAACAEVRRSK